MTSVPTIGLVTGRSTNAKAVRQRSSLTSGIVGTVVCGLILLAGLLDLHRGVDPLMPALAALGAAGFWVLLVRPSVRLGESEVLVSNPLREWTIALSPLRTSAHDGRCGSTLPRAPSTSGP